MSKTIEEIRKELELKYSFALIGSQALIADEVSERFAQSQTQELIEAMKEIHAITKKSSAGGIHIGNIRTIVDRVLTKYHHLKSNTNG